MTTSRTGKPSLKTSAGFTLMELLIALTILGTVAGVLYSVMRSGLNAYERGTALTAEQQDAYGFFTLLRSDMLRMVEGTTVPESGSSIRIVVADEQSQQIVTVLYQTTERGLVRSEQFAATDEKPQEAGVVVLPADYSFQVTPIAQKEGDKEEQKGGKNANGIAVRLEKKDTGTVYEDIFRFAYAQKPPKP